jgi:hypothetical protein
MSTAYNVARYLATQGIGTWAGSSGWSINVSREAVSPDKCITIYDTGGEEPDTDQLDERPTFQVRVRSAKTGDAYLDAHAKQVAIRDLLTAEIPPVMNGVAYVGIMQMSEIASIGRDENDRHLLVANYRARREK